MPADLGEGGEQKKYQIGIGAAKEGAGAAGDCEVHVLSRAPESFGAPATPVGQKRAAVMHQWCNGNDAADGEHVYVYIYIYIVSYNIHISIYVHVELQMLCGVINVFLTMMSLMVMMMMMMMMTTMMMMMMMVILVGTSSNAQTSIGLSKSSKICPAQRFMQDHPWSMVIVLLLDIPNS